MPETTQHVTTPSTSPPSDPVQHTNPPAPETNTTDISVAEDVAKLADSETGTSTVFAPSPASATDVQSPTAKQNFYSSTVFKVGMPIAAAVLIVSAYPVAVELWKLWKRWRATCTVDDSRVYTELQDTFDNSSVGQPVPDCGPRLHPPTVPANSSVPSLLEYIRKQLDSFSTDFLFHRRYFSLGPSERMEGGGILDSLDIVLHWNVTTIF